MGYAVYQVKNDRWAGYGVPAICDYPGCGVAIDRGLDYCCGGEPNPEKGCGLYFCSEHLYISIDNEDPQMCKRCCDEEQPFEPTPDTLEWVTHMLTDESWGQWRTENPSKVAEMEKVSG